MRDFPELGPAADAPAASTGSAALAGLAGAFAACLDGGGAHADAFRLAFDLGRSDAVAAESRP
jgi:hypothetical protein